jgi:hypothetical protein
LRIQHLFNSASCSTGRVDCKSYSLSNYQPAVYPGNESQSEPIRGAAHTTSTPIQDMGVHHRRTGILVQEKLESSAQPTGE